MKLIHSKVEIIPQSLGLSGIYKQIELAGRTAYKSEDKITSDSAKAFVDMLIGRGHTAPLEHGSIYLILPCENNDSANYITALKYRENRYSKVNFDVINDLRFAFITTNARVIYENG